MVPAPVHRLLGDVVERVVHPAHVPLEREAEPSAVGRPGDARPGRRLLRDHRDAGVRAVDDRVQLPQERRRLEVLPAAVAVRHPLAGLARVVEVEHRRDGVDSQAVGMELLEPVEGVREQEVAHLVACVVEDERPPVGVRAAPRVGVLVQRRAVEAGERPLVAREVGGHPVEQHADPVPVELVDELPEVVRLAQRRLRGEVPGHLVAPRGPVRVLHDGHQLDVREAELHDVLAQLVREVAPAEALPPRGGVHLVHRHRRREGIRRRTPRQPLRVVPRVPRAVQDRRGGGRRLRPEGKGVGLETGHAVGPAHGELVGLALARVRRDAGPHARRRLRRERIRALAPEVPVADDRDRPRVRRPHGEPRTGLVVERVAPELLPETLVAALAEQVEVELARRRHAVVSSMRSSPTTGIATQSGRFRAS